jgi:predicted metalloprotease with PDZ domain
MSRSLLAVLLTLAAAFPCLAADGDARVFDVDYRIGLAAGRDDALVTIRLGDGARWVRRLNFRIDPARHTGLKADGDLQVEADRAIWIPPKEGGTLTLHSKITHQRAKGDYDALINRDWAIFRGDDVIPAASARLVKRATSRARLRFDLPTGWGVTTGWPKSPDGVFTIANPQRKFDRPVGWMIAGHIGIRLDRIGVTELVVAAPDGHDVRRLEILTFLNFVWPEMEHAFGKAPRKLLIVAADDPMWRGGLSSPNSLFMHSTRPIISGNGTSPLLHELTHMITRVRGQANDDWIAEGLAEYYSIELLRRAGGMSDARYERERAWLKRWSRDVTNLRVRNSKGRTTARAVLLFQELDAEIRERSDEQHDIDDVAQALMKAGKVSLSDLRAAAKKAIGGDSKTLQSPLLR